MSSIILATASTNLPPYCWVIIIFEGWVGQAGVLCQRALGTFIHLGSSLQQQGLPNTSSCPRFIDHIISRIHEKLQDGRYPSRRNPMNSSRSIKEKSASLLQLRTYQILPTGVHLHKTVLCV
jgi:hypothetical protein